jgi:outer membrane receptor protein involved in Fe transport
MDNSENERKNPSARNAAGYVDKVINPYTVVNAGLSFDLIPALKKNSPVVRFLKSFEGSLKVNNVFNVLYETYGSVDGYGIPYWIPAATRNIYFNLKLGF